MGGGFRCGRAVGGWFQGAGVDTEGRGYGEELVALLSAVTAALRCLPGQVHRLTEPDLAAVLPILDGLASVAVRPRSRSPGRPMSG